MACSTAHDRARRATIAVITAVVTSTAAAAGSLFPDLPPDETPRAQLVRALNRTGRRHLDARQAAVARITTAEELEQRGRVVRTSLLRLMGGLPEDRTPLDARVTGRLSGPGFTVEKVVFQSLPGFPVTASFYRPSGPGPFPGILASVGHGEAGKAGERLGPDLARKGFAVLQYDPLGQGERLQHYDPALHASRAGGSTEEHGQEAARAELIGDSVARYFVWDAMRAIDYLGGRPDVVAERIGAAGCSGGGTVTTYLAALDPRVKAAVIGCYVTSWSALLEGPGPQEAEQTLAGFLAAGHDMGDWLALIAPRPLLVVSTTDDFFPLEGARAVYEETRAWYALHGAEERISWSVGPGGHGIRREGREAIAAFFLRWLGDPSVDAKDEPDARPDPEDLECTDTGQVATSLSARTVADLVAARAASLLGRRPATGIRPGPPSRRPEAGPGRLRRRAAEVAGIDLPVGAPRPLRVHRTEEGDGYRLQVVSFAVEIGLDVWGLLAEPSGEGRKAAVLVFDPRLRTAPGPELDQLAREGRVVLAVEPRGTLTATELPARPTPLGPYAALYRRAAALGRSLVGLRAEDVLHATAILAARPDVDPEGIAAFGFGAAAVPLLHAAVLEPRISRLALQEAPVSYRAFLDHPIHRGLPEILVPGVLRHYDLDDLVEAVAPRPVAWINPLDAVGRPLRKHARERYLGEARVLRRRPGDALLWE